MLNASYLFYPKPMKNQTLPMSSVTPPRAPSKFTLLNTLLLAICLFNSSGCGSSPTGILPPPPPPVQKFSLSGTISSASSGSGSTVSLTGAASATTNADNSGNYSFANLADGSYTLTPSKTGFTFSPASLSASISGANISGLNFVASASSQNALFFDDFTGSNLTTSWTAVDRAGDGGEFQCNKPANNTVTGGNLVINAQFQSPPITCQTSTVPAASYSFTSGMVMWKSLSFTYGTVEIRMQLPSSCVGCRPVVWMLGSNCQSTTPSTPDNTGTCNWPFPGSEEIDIAEFIGSNYGQVNQFLHASGGDHGGPVNLDVSTGYHVYDMIWTPGQIVFKIDGSTTQTIAAGDVPSMPMFLIIEDTMEGSGCPAGGPTCSVTGLPATMSIDYVKVTQP